MDHYRDRERERGSHQKKKSEFIFGIHPILEAIKAGKEIERVYLLKQVSGEALKDLLALVKKHKIPFALVPNEKLNKITHKAHQGAIAYLSAVTYSSLDYVLEDAYSEGRMPFILVLDSITDVRNFGALCRTAECAGVDAVIIPSKGAARVSEDAIKTSAGALHHIRLCRASNLIQTVRYLRDSGLEIISCTEKTEDGLYSGKFNAPVAIVMGSEEFGVSSEILKISSQKVKIPLLGEIGSLNVSVAAGIVLYEARRQQLGD